MVVPDLGDEDGAVNFGETSALVHHFSITDHKNDAMPLKRTQSDEPPGYGEDAIAVCETSDCQIAVDEADDGIGRRALGDTAGIITIHMSAWRGRNRIHQCLQARR